MALEYCISNDGYLLISVLNFANYCSYVMGPMHTNISVLTCMYCICRSKIDLLITVIYWSYIMEDINNHN